MLNQVGPHAGHMVLLVWQAHQVQVEHFDPENQVSAGLWHSSKICVLFCGIYGTTEIKNSTLAVLYNSSQITHSLVNQPADHGHICRRSPTITLSCITFFENTIGDSVLLYPLTSKQLWLESVISAKKQCQHHKFGHYLNRMFYG